MNKTLKKNQPKELQEYIQKNYNVGIKHYKRVFSQREHSTEDIFYLFVFCVLVPGGKATRTKLAVDELKKIDFYTIDLNTDVIDLNSVISQYIRFPQQKIQRLINLKRIWPLFIEWLYTAMKYKIPATKIRENIVKNLDGFGYKAASHVLRNLGYTDLAVIDTHILKYAQYWLPFASKSVQYPGTKKQYLHMEDCFRQWSNSRFKLDPCILDWFIWCKESGNNINSLEC